MPDMARKAVGLTRDLDPSGYDEDETLRLALVYLVQVIGEAARHVSAGCRQEHPEIPWRQVTGMRRKVVHDYLDVDYRIVWDVVTGELPGLVLKLEKSVDRPGRLTARGRMPGRQLMQAARAVWPSGCRACRCRWRPAGGRQSRTRASGRTRTGGI